MGVTQELMTFLLGTRFQDLPAAAVNRAKDLIIDFVGGALGGSQTSTSSIFSQYVKEKASRPEARVIGKNFKTTAAYASYLNGYFNHSTELEAVSQRTSPNPLAVIAVSLAVGEKEHLSGKEVISALILGFELQGRVGGPSLGAVSKKGRISIFNPLGAAAAASRLMQLNLAQARMALGMALFQAGGLIANVGTTAHVLELAYAGRDGIEAAELAKKGFTSHPDIIETPQGFLDALADGGGGDLEKITRDLGRPFQIIDPGISIKKYPCCYRSHRALDALMDILAEHSISYADIEKVAVDLNRYDSYLMKFPDPRTGEEAMFSFPHILGAAILKGKVWLESFTDESVIDPEYQEARRKIEEVVHADWPVGRVDARTPVTVKLKDGRVFCKEIAAPREPTPDQLLDRYRQGADRVLTRKQTEASIDLLLSLDHLQDLSELMDLMVRKR